MSSLFETPVEFEAAFRNYWKITTKLPNIGILIGDIEGNALFANEAARRMYYGDESFDPTGKTLAELEGEEVAAERVALVKRVCESGQPVTIRHTRRGVQLESVLFPWCPNSQESTPRHIVAFTHAVVFNGDVDENNVDCLESQYTSWGQLDSLTNRQLEVLAALRSGLSQKEAAKTLGVTAKTIETHRDQLIRRLGLSSTLQAIRLADRAGLTLENARKTRHVDTPWERYIAAQKDRVAQSVSLV